MSQNKPEPKNPPIGVLGAMHPAVKEGLSSYPALVANGPDNQPPAREASNLKAAAVSPGIGGRLDGATLDRFPKLEFLASFGVGYDYIDLEAVKARNIIVTNTPGVLTEEVADTAFGLLLNALRRFPQAEAFVREGRWGAEQFPLTETLQGRKMGILGMGRIGRAIARRAEAFGLSVAYHNRRRHDDVSYPYFASAQELAKACNVLVCVLPGGDDTRHAIDGAVLAALGPDGVLVNVGRGPCVDEKALIAALESRAILAAALDVYEDEPDVPQALRASPHVALAPHVGSATKATRAAMAKLVVDNLLSYARGDGPLTPIPETPWPPRS